MNSPQELARLMLERAKHFKNATALCPTTPWMMSVIPESLISVLDVAEKMAEALKYIADRDWAIGKDKWDAEFHEVAREALALWRGGE